jgi:hypothetical protein
MMRLEFVIYGAKIDFLATKKIINFESKGDALIDRYQAYYLKSLI